MASGRARKAQPSAKPAVVAENSTPGAYRLDLSEFEPSKQNAPGSEVR